MDKMSKKGNVTIIGGGIIGLCSAYYLLNDGFQVTVIDQGDFNNNCSSGNAGMIVPSHFVPLAAPGMISKGIKWMFDSKSPFYVKPSLNKNLLTWGIKFWQYANDKHVLSSAAPLCDYHLLSKKLYEDLNAQKDLQFGFENKGILMLYKNESSAEEEIHLAGKAKELGLEVNVLTAKEAQELEPHTTLDVLGAVHYRCDAHLSPNDLVPQLINFLKKKGVKLIGGCKVNGFSFNDKKITSISTDQGAFDSDLVVMTGGAWLPELAKMAGLRIPVMPGKGYSFKIDPIGGQILHPSLLLEARVAVTPMGDKIRFGGTMEIAQINHQININRVQGIVNSIPKYYPEYQVSVPELKDIWYGFRPCSPDGLPYLGYSRKIQNLIIAGGHGMMGLSLAPATGKIVADLAMDRPHEIDIASYLPERFN